LKDLGVLTGLEPVADRLVYQTSFRCSTARE
jgi:hypothetical protein